MSTLDNRKVLILGASSYVGRHLYKYLCHRINNRVIATYNRNPIPNGVHFDSTSMELSDVISNSQEISYSVILLGDTNPDSCASDKDRSYKLNVESIKSIVDYLVRFKIKPVFASSEFVFDGNRGNYTEEDTPIPILTYGRQKLEIEEYIKRVCDDYIIFRLAKVFGDTLGDGTIFTKWLDDIEKHRVINCANDQIFSPVYVNDVVESIVRLVENNCQGIFNVAGSHTFNRLSLLEMLIAEVKKYSTDDIKIMPCSIDDFNLAEKRPKNVSLKVDKLIYTIGIRLSSIEDICRKIVTKSFNDN